MSVVKSDNSDITINASGTSSEIKFQCNGTEVAKIDSTGFVGAGSPSIDDNGNATAITIDSSENVGIGTSSPSHKLSVEGSSGSRTILNADGVGTTVNINTRIRPNGQGGVEVGSTSSDAYLHSLVDGGSMVLSTRHGSTDTERMRIDSAGRVTMPYQPAFQVHSVAQNNVGLNTAVVVRFGNERFDEGSNFDTGTYRFTAPITGKYLLTFHLSLNAPDAASGFYQFYITTSNRTYIATNTIAGSTDPTYWTFAYSIVADMDANDTAHIAMYQNVGTSQTDVRNESNFSGYLVA